MQWTRIAAIASLSETLHVKSAVVFETLTMTKLSIGFSFRDV